MNDGPYWLAYRFASEHGHSTKDAYSFAHRYSRYAASLVAITNLMKIPDAWNAWDETVKQEVTSL